MARTKQAARKASKSPAKIPPQQLHQKQALATNSMPAVMPSMLQTSSNASELEPNDLFDFDEESEFQANATEKVGFLQELEELGKGTHKNQNIIPSKLKSKKKGQASKAIPIQQAPPTRRRQNTYPNVLPSSHIQIQDKYLQQSTEERRSHYAGKKFVSLDVVPTWAQLGPDLAKRRTEEEAGKGRRREGPAPQVADVNADLNSVVALHKGDIALLEVDAVVISTNANFSKHNMAKSVFDAAGTNFNEELGQLKRGNIFPKQIGDAVILCGYDAPAFYVLMVNSPMGKQTEALGRCYSSILGFCRSYGIRSMAIPCLSTGGYGFPARDAAAVALSTTREWLQTPANRAAVDRILFCTYKDEDFHQYARLMPAYFPLPGNTNLSLSLTSLRVMNETSTLVRLDLLTTQVRDVGILDACKWLDLSGSAAVNDAFFAALAHIAHIGERTSRVTHLSLFKCANITDVALLFIPIAFPNLIDLDLSGCMRIRGHYLAHLASRLGNLQDLALKDIRLTFPLTQKLKELTETSDSVQDRKSRNRKTSKSSAHLVLRVVIVTCPAFDSNSLDSFFQSGPYNGIFSVSPNLHKAGSYRLQFLRCHISLAKHLVGPGTVFVLPPLGEEAKESAEMLFTSLIVASQGNCIILTAKFKALTKVSKAVETALHSYFLEKLGKLSNSEAQVSAANVAHVHFKIQDYTRISNTELGEVTNKDGKLWTKIGQGIEAEWGADLWAGKVEEFPTLGLVSSVDRLTLATAQLTGDCIQIGKIFINTAGFAQFITELANHSNKMLDYFILLPALGPSAKVTPIALIRSQLESHFPGTNVTLALADAVVESLCGAGLGYACRRPWLVDMEPKPVMALCPFLPNEPIQPLATMWPVAFGDMERELCLRLEFPSVVPSGLLHTILHHVSSTFHVANLLWARGFLLTRGHLTFLGLEEATSLRLAVRGLTLRQRTKADREVKELWGPEAKERLEEDVRDGFRLLRRALSLALRDFPVPHSMRVKCPYCRGDGREHWYGLDVVRSGQPFKCSTFNDQLDAAELGFDVDLVQNCDHEALGKGNAKRLQNYCLWCWGKSLSGCSRCQLCSACAAFFQERDGKALGAGLACLTCEQELGSRAELRLHWTMPCVGTDSPLFPSVDENVYKCTAAPFLLRCPLSSATTQRLDIHPIAHPESIFLVFRDQPFGKGNALTHMALPPECISSLHSISITQDNVLGESVYTPVPATIRSKDPSHMTGSLVQSLTMYPDPGAEFPAGASAMVDWSAGTTEGWRPALSVLHAGLSLEAVDAKNPTLVGPATITHFDLSASIAVHFDSWDDNYDMTTKLGSPMLKPIGYQGFQAPGSATRFHLPGGPTRWANKHGSPEAFKKDGQLIEVPSPIIYQTAVLAQKIVPPEFFVAKEQWGRPKGDDAMPVGDASWSMVAQEAMVAQSWAVGQKCEVLLREGGGAKKGMRKGVKFSDAAENVESDSVVFAAATVVEVMDKEVILLVDGAGLKEAKQRKKTSHRIRPIGYAQYAGLEFESLLPDWNGWEMHLSKSGSVPVPFHCFTLEQLNADYGKPENRPIPKHPVFEFFETLQIESTDAAAKMDPTLATSYVHISSNFMKAWHSVPERTWLNTMNEESSTVLLPRVAVEGPPSLSLSPLAALDWASEAQALFNCTMRSNENHDQSILRCSDAIPLNKNTFSWLKLKNPTNLPPTVNDEKDTPTANKHSLSRHIDADETPSNVAGFVMESSPVLMEKLRRLLDWNRVPFHIVYPFMESDAPGEAERGWEACWVAAEAVLRLLSAQFLALRTLSNWDDGHSDRAMLPDRVKAIKTSHKDNRLSSVMRFFNYSQSLSRLVTTAWANAWDGETTAYDKYIQEEIRLEKISSSATTLETLRQGHSVRSLSLGEALAETPAVAEVLSSAAETLPSVFRLGAVGRPQLFATPNALPFRVRGSFWAVSLSDLSVSRTPLPCLPEPLKHLKLNIYMCALRKIPGSIIGALRKLEILSMDENLFTELPDELANLEKLEMLTISAVPLLSHKGAGGPVTIENLVEHFKEYHLDFGVDLGPNEASKKDKSGRSSGSFLDQFSSSSARRGSSAHETDDASRIQQYLRNYLNEHSEEAAKSRTKVKPGKVSKQKNWIPAHVISHLANFKSTPIEEDQTVVLRFLNEWISTFLAPRFAEFPAVLSRLRSLTYLAIRHHTFRNVPAEIRNLRHLNILLLGGCRKLREVAGEVGALPLTTLDVGDCPSLKTPPLEMVRRGQKSVLAYLRRILTGSRECKRTKLMLVGLGGAGKTSLVKALMAGDFKTTGTTDKEITDGIDIKDWTVRIHDPKTEKEITLNYSVWDFAGQSVYYNTHQFFLSNRAVYLLLWNTRQGYEHAGLEFWLSSITCHAPKAKIFVVGTHADQVERADLPKEDLKATFPSIVHFSNISAITGQGVAELAEALHHTTRAQSYMGELVPSIWLQFESLLQARRRVAILPFSEAENFGIGLGMLDSAEVREALAFLHELGSVQYFPSEFLKNRVVVNPQWLVDVMACLITVKKSVIHEGRFKRSDIGQIWAAYASDLHKWLLRLTEEFDLSFALPEGNLSVVPCLLPPQEPEFEWPLLDGPDREMKMTYLFEYLPAGLFNRAQTRLCHYSDSHVIWKKGSLLRKNAHTALIRQTKDKELLIKVQGPRPENVLFLVHEVVEGLIAEFFSGVSYDISIPCADCVRAGSQDPHMFFARNIRRAGDMKAPFLQCAKSFHIVSLEALREFLPPSRPSDLERHLTGLMADIKDLRASVTTKVLFLYSKKDNRNASLPIRPEAIIKDLEEAGIHVVVLEEEKAGSDMGKLGSEVASCLLLVAAISDNFCADSFTSSIFQFVKVPSVSFQRPILSMVLSSKASWQKTDVGMLLASELYLDCTKAEKYPQRRDELIGRIKGKSKSVGGGSRRRAEGGVFLSYCWTNSAAAVAAGSRRVAGATEGQDPRTIAAFLTQRGVPVWIDTSTLKEGVLFEEIAEALRGSKAFVACVSDQYLASNNCMLEYRFAVGVLKLPLIVCAVGKGFKWQQSEIAMLALKAPRVDMQSNEAAELELLLSRVREVIGESAPPPSRSSSDAERPKSRPRTVKELKDARRQSGANLSAYQEMCELAQRKFLQQLMKVNRDVRDRCQLTDPSTGEQSAFPSPFPRLFVLDVTPSTDDNSMMQRNQARANPLLRLHPSRFRIRFLCEHEKGWHVSGADVPVTIDASADVWNSNLLKMAAFLAPLYAILHYSSLSLNILEDPALNPAEDDFSVLHFLKQTAQADTNEERFTEGYELLLSCAALADGELSRGSLKRGSLHSRRILWLCDAHQKDARDVINNDELDLDDVPLATDGGAAADPDDDDHDEDAYPPSPDRETELLKELRSAEKKTEAAMTAVVATKSSINVGDEQIGRNQMGKKNKSKTCNIL